MDISIIIVSWNVRELLRKCLYSVFGVQCSVFSIQSADDALNTENRKLNPILYPRISSRASWFLRTPYAMRVSPAVSAVSGVG